MKKMGLVGGTGPESTLMYYKELNAGIDRLTGGAAMPDLTVESVNFRRAWGYVSDGEYGLLADYLSEKVRNLADAGCEVIALTAVTMHIVYDDIVRKTGICPVSIPGAVCEEAVARGIRKVGLLGTRFTMEMDFMKRDLQQAGIEVVVPEQAERELVAKRILEELEIGIVKESTRQELNDVIGRMRSSQGIEAVILGCTELPLLLDNENCVLPCLDSVDIHIRKLIDLAMGRPPAIGDPLIS